MAIIPYNKRYSETLSSLLDRFRKENPLYAESKITYAGRLDPMAEGLMLLLTDDDVHKKEELIGLDKIYEVEFILGIETDSYDILGIISGFEDAFTMQVSKVQEYVQDLQGDHNQAYPPYSSKTIQGKPMWQWARENALDTLEIPKHSVTVHTAKYLGFNSDNEYNLLTKIQTALSLVEGDFRQIDCIMVWQEFFKEYEGYYRIYSAEFTVSSGTYIRSLIHELGQKLQTGAVCMRIIRKTVGDYSLVNEQ